MSADARSFARWKFRFVEAAGTCADLTGPDFRFLTYVLHRLPEGSRKASVGDAAVREEVPGHARRDAVRLARARIQQAGFWIATRGNGKQATIYEIRDDRIPELEEAMKVRAKRRKDLREEAAEAFRALSAIRRGELVPSPPKIEPPSEEASVNLVDTSTPGFESPQKRELSPPQNEPPYNINLPVEATNKEVPLRARPREGRIQLFSPSPSELEPALLEIGDGDPERGMLRLDLLDDAQLSAFAERLDECGFELSLSEIRAVKSAAMRIERAESARRSKP